MAGCGIDFAASVPCSSIAGLLRALDSRQDITHLGATSEAEAVGIAAGAWLAGARPAVLMQNSGFCDSLNPIGSLLEPFSIPLLFMVTGRGAFGLQDEPQHRRVGAAMARLAESFGLPFAVLTEDCAQIRPCLADALRRARQGGHGAVLALPVGALDGGDGQPAAGRGRRRPAEVMRDGTGAAPSRRQCIAMLRQASPAAIFVATTGLTGRELFAAGDGDTNLYLAGSMGCASAVGLGIALHAAQPVVVLDGDGAMLMRMGNCASIGAQAPRRFAHIVLNNASYASTGGQPSLGRSTDLAAVAQACGYGTVLQTGEPDRAADALEAVMADDLPSPLFIDLWVAADIDASLPRPAVPPANQTDRLRRRLASCGRDNRKRRE